MSPHLLPDPPLGKAPGPEESPTTARLEDAQRRGTWIECAFDVEGRHIGVSVRRLDDDDRRRMAAQIAWFADGLLTAGVELRTTGWPALLDEILSRCVAITLEEDGLEGANEFWNQVICRAFEAFLSTNRLSPPRETAHRQRTARARSL